MYVILSIKDGIKIVRNKGKWKSHSKVSILLELPQDKLTPQSQIGPL